MVRGRTVVLSMLIVGGLLLGGYEVVRRLSAPRGAELVEDLGQKQGRYDRLYRFRDEVYRIREAGPVSGAWIAVAVRRKDGSDGPLVERACEGHVETAHFLEPDDDAPPIIVVIARLGGSDGPADGIAFRREGEEIRAWPLEPLPEELLPRYRGGDIYERQGAFLYRRLELAPAEPGGKPKPMRFFYDFPNARWVASE